MKVKVLEKWKGFVKEKKKPGKKFTMLIAGILMAALAGGGIGYHMLKVQAAGAVGEKEEGLQQMMGESQGLTEEGTTQMGTIAQMPEFAVNILSLQVEEVYVEAGSAVNEGDALFKLTDESMTAITEYYAEAVATAKDTLETAELEYENGSLEAKYTKQEALLNAEEAPAVLEAALLELEESIQEKKEVWEQAKTDIAAYTSNLENNTYYTNAGIDEKTTAITVAEETLKTAESEYKSAEEAYKAAEENLQENIKNLSAESKSEEWSEVTINKIKELVVAITEGYQDTSGKETKLDEKKAAFEKANQELEKAKMTLEEATFSYEKNTEEATQKLSELEGSVEELEHAYETAVREAETTKVDLQNEYDLAILEGNYAETTYSATLVSLKDTVEAARTELEELEEAQAAIASIENGVVCANQTGTLAAVTYEAEDILKAETAFVYYYDTSVITISVEVAQEDIAKIAVGDSVSVMISNNRRGNLQGTVTSIASTATTGGSVSNVTYAVEISIDNTDGTMSAGLSATVVFSDEVEVSDIVEPESVEAVKPEDTESVRQEMEIEKENIQTTEA